MKAVHLESVIRSRRFRPFLLVLADGTRVRVKDPEWIAYAGGRKAAVVDSDDHTYVIDLVHVVRLKWLDTES